jgi:catechol 2,3-dioxygenase-like lactoylglutathione lyase family enzyme
MTVSGLDHVNILTADLEATASFYERVLGLTRDRNRTLPPGFQGAWMRDAAGNAIVHLVWKDPASDRYDGYEPGLPTNAVHHVAFQCQGFDAMRERLDGLGIAYRVSDRRHAALRQVFLADPNAVNIELNFAGE